MSHNKVSKMSTLVRLHWRQRHIQSYLPSLGITSFHKCDNNHLSVGKSIRALQVSKMSLNLAVRNPVKVSVRTLVTSNANSGNVLHSQDIFNIEGQIDAVQQGGNFAVLFSDSIPVIFTVDFLCVLKDLPGMSWIGTILLGTVLARALVAFPVAIIQQRLIGRLAELKPEFQSLAMELKRETALAIKKFNWDEKTAKRQFTKSYKKHWRKLVEENNCHPMRILALSLVQLPVWICLSSAIRNIVYALPLPRTTEMLESWSQIHGESFPWAGSLVVPDPLVLPAVFLVTNLLNIQFSRRNKPKDMPETKLQKAIPWLLRGGIVGIAFISTSVPSAVALYWASSSTIAFTQNIFLSSEFARSLLKLPNVQQATEKPMNNENVLDSTSQQQKQKEKSI